MFFPKVHLFENGKMNRSFCSLTGGSTQKKRKQAQKKKNPYIDFKFCEGLKSEFVKNVVN